MDRVEIELSKQNVMFNQILFFVEALLLADLLTGLVHWLEDTYGNPNTQFMGIGKHIVIPNLVHHIRPRELTQGTWFSRVWTSAVFLLILLFLLWVFNCDSPMVYMVFAIAVWGNEVHCWSHRSPKENGKLITFLQKSYIIQSPKQHGKHHFSPYASHFCALTPYLNPILEMIYFWRILEFALKLIGIKPFRGTTHRIVDGKHY